MVKVWFLCPVCGQKLLIIDKTKFIEGVFAWCKRHKGNIEIKNEPEPIA
jgi:transcription initiation factor IIE alpha subunit